MLTAFSVSNNDNDNNLIGSCQYREGNAWPIQFDWINVMKSYEFFKCSDLTVYHIIKDEKKNFKSYT
jgi:hypothetical protein